MLPCRQLAEYETLVSDLLSNRFVNLAVTIPVAPVSTGITGDLSDQAGGWEEGAAQEDGGGKGGDGGGAGLELRRDLQLVVQGLLRLGEMKKVLGIVQERVSEDLKLIIRYVGSVSRKRE